MSALQETINLTPKTNNAAALAAVEALAKPSSHIGRTLMYIIIAIIVFVFILSTWAHYKYIQSLRHGPQVTNPVGIQNISTVYRIGNYIFYALILFFLLSFLIGGAIYASKH